MAQRSLYIGLAMASLALTGCPRTAPTATAMATGAEAWVVFDAVEMGSQVPLLTYVRVDGHVEDLETVADDQGFSPSSFSQ